MFSIMSVVGNTKVTENLHHYIFNLSSQHSNYHGSCNTKDSKPTLSYYSKPEALRFNYFPTDVSI